MADYLKSPVFSSPSYWIALGVGVVGIGAAAVQEGRKGSAAYRPYTSYGGDPYWMNAKYAGTDAKGLAFKKGERVFYYPKTKTIYAGGNAEAASHDFQSMAADEDFMGGGSYNQGSAAYGSITPPADAVFYATTRGGKWQIVVTPAGEHKGEAFYDMKDYKNGSLHGSGHNNLAGLRARIPDLLYYSAMWDGIYYEVKIDTLGLDKAVDAVLRGSVPFAGSATSKRRHS
jgi:hypothetical protein